MACTAFVTGGAVVDGVQKADEPLVPMLLHVAPDYGSIEDVERSEQGGGAVALLITRHCAEPAFLHRPRLPPIRANPAAFGQAPRSGSFRRRTT